MKAITEEEYRQTHIKALKPLIIGTILFLLSFALIFATTVFEESPFKATIMTLALLSLLAMVPIIFWAFSISSYANDNIVITQDKIFIPGKMMRSFNKDQRFEISVKFGGEGAKIIRPTLIIDKQNIASCSLDNALVEKENYNKDIRTYYASKEKKSAHIVFTKSIVNKDVEKVNDFFVDIENYNQFRDLINK